jgi:predicted amidohydrolase YtcJ
LLTVTADAFADATCIGGKDLILDNGDFLTMDANSTVAKAVRIRGSRLIAIDDVGDKSDPCVEIIDLGGRTVVPGLIDSHTHFIRTAQQPGYMIHGLEAVSSIAEFLSILRATTATVPAGEVISAAGGFSPVQFKERRLPTWQELDAAAPDHPVYLQESYMLPGLVNTRGREYFADHGFTIDDSHIAPARSPALDILLRNQNPRQIERRFEEYMRYASSLGLTMVVDAGCCHWLGTHVGADELPGLQHAEKYWRDGALPLRLRLHYNHRGTIDQDDIQSVSARLENATMGLGDDMFRVVGVGEQVIGQFERPASEEETLEVYRRIARKGWTLSQHAMTEKEIEFYLRIMERVADNISLEKLRWTLEHVFEITPEQISRLQSIGVSVRVQNQDYLNDENAAGYWRFGPPFRTLLESGIKMGAGTDAGVVSPLNPWLSIEFMLTGKNAGGALLIPDQQIERLEALRLYTAANAWFTFEEDELGSLEVGKLADLTVLDRPYLSIATEEIREITSVLTMVNGNVVYAQDPFARLER